TLMTHSVYAADEKIEVTPTPQVTQQELAAIYVLSDICPSLVSDQAKFAQGYAKLTKEYLPNEKNPVTALEKLGQQKSFRSVLNEAQSDAQKAGNEKNKEICQELSTYAN
nr:hypothetical protein [Acinetobacter sp.]